MTGILIEVAAIDGAGKTTLISNLSQALAEKGYTYHLAQALSGSEHKPFLSFVGGLKTFLEEAGHSDTLNEIRHYQSLTYSFSFAEKVFHDIIPALKTNDFVIADRYLLSHKVYQEAFEESSDSLSGLYELFPKPDYTVFIEIPSNLALERIENRGIKKEWFETLDFLESANRIFEKQLNTTDNVIRLNGTLPREQVCQQALDKILGQRKVIQEKTESFATLQDHPLAKQSLDIGFLLIFVLGFTWKKARRR